MKNRIAILSEAKIFLAERGGKPEPLACSFADRIRQRERQTAQKNSWKSGDTEDPTLVRATVWGRLATQQGMSRIDITSMACIAPQTLGFCLETDTVGGFFTVSLRNGEEKRIFHRQNLEFADLAVHPVSGKLACAVAEGSLTCGVGVMEPGGGRLRVITEGDSQDNHPAWYADGEALIYQSAGIARGADGYVRGVGPVGLEKLDFETGEVSTLLASDQWDYLCPRPSADGGLYFIRRPYEMQGQKKVGILTTIKDILLWPFRLLRAIAAFLNFFSMIFTKKPLMTAGKPKPEESDNTRMWLLGRWVDASQEKGMASNGGGLVPDSWQLIHRDKNGVETTLAKKVVGYDLCPNGAILHSDGRRVWLRQPSGQTDLWVQSDRVSRVVWLGETPDALPTIRAAGEMDNEDEEENESDSPQTPARNSP